MCTCWFGKAKEAGCGAEINRDIIKIDKLRIKDRMSVLVLVQHSKKKSTAEVLVWVMMDRCHRSDHSAWIEV